MQVLVIGSGPIGLTVGAALARRGHRVLGVDRDPGPAADGTWSRRGVMQFGHAHGFRPQVRELLVEQWPEAYEAWLAAGAEPVTIATPGPGPGAVGVRSRRGTYERALRSAAACMPGLTLRAGHVDGLGDRGGRVVGAVVDGALVEADLVVDASGRASRLAAAGPKGGAVVGGDCGIAYVNRLYRHHAGVEPGPFTNPIGWFGEYDGYQVLIFPHERGWFSAVIVRPTADPELKVLRHREAFDAACAAIPGLATWTDPDRSAPAGEVSVGGHLENVYRPQRGLLGLVAVGDAITTTAPTAGRGVAMGSMQIGALLGLLDAGADPGAAAEPFGAWCDEQVRPWVLDHVANDGEAVRRWQGADLDLSGPLTSAAITAAAQVDPSIMRYAGPYLGMTALPESLAPAEPLARVVYGSGWRPAYSPGPTRDELLALASAALARPAA